MNKNQIYDDLLNKFKHSNECTNKPCWILQNGEFLEMEKAHGEADEYIASIYKDFNIIKASKCGILLDWFNAIRVNSGNIFYKDCYIQLPDAISQSQFRSLKYWIDNLSEFEISIEFNNKLIVSNKDRLFLDIQNLISI